LFGFLAVVALFILVRASRRAGPVQVILPGAQGLIDGLRPRSPLEVSLPVAVVEALDKLSQGQGSGGQTVRVQSEVTLPEDLQKGLRVLLTPSLVEQSNREINEVTQKLADLEQERSARNFMVDNLTGERKRLDLEVSGLRIQEDGLKRSVGALETQHKQLTDSTESYAAANRKAQEEYQRVVEMERAVTPAGGTTVTWSDKDERLRVSLLKLNSERPQRLVRLFGTPSIGDQLQAWKSVTEGSIFASRGHLVVPIPDGVRCKAVISIIRNKGVTEATAGTVVQEGLDLEEAEWEKYLRLLQSSQGAWTHEQVYPPVFMAPFWNISLRSIYKCICQAKHVRYSGDFPTPPDLAYTFEAGFQLLLDEYLQPFIEEVVAQDNRYQGGRKNYPTNQGLLNPKLEHSMEEGTGKVIFGEWSIQQVHGMVERLNQDVRDQNLKDYCGFTRLRAAWDGLRDEGARRRWATVCAALDPYIREFLWRPLKIGS
jgi:hypothetical protein